jgi:hypothetical protein
LPPKKTKSLCFRCGRTRNGAISIKRARWLFRLGRFFFGDEPGQATFTGAYDDREGAVRLKWKIPDE